MLNPSETYEVHKTGKQDAVEIYNNNFNYLIKFMKHQHHKGE